MVNVLSVLKIVHGIETSVTIIRICFNFQFKNGQNLDHWRGKDAVKLTNELIKLYT